VKLIFHQQGTPPWHAWRWEGVGGSDIPAIMGCSPYEDATRESLFCEKTTGVKKETNFAMRKGNRLEPIARRSHEVYSGLRMEPCCCEHEEQSWMHASLDGWHPEGRFIEIKYAKAHYHWRALNGLVPRHVMVQIQWQFMVSGLPACDFVSVNDGQKDFDQPRQFMAIVRVLPDAELMAHILTEAEKFWVEVLAWRESKPTVDARETVASWNDRDEVLTVKN
jgi:putative phage-type endonuclease